MLQFHRFDLGMVKKKAATRLGTRGSTRAERVAAARVLGAFGGRANSPAQMAARRENAKLAGRPRRICTTCGLPLWSRGGGDTTHDPDTCPGRSWRLQSRRERREQDNG